jgi:16S rRNA (cytosine967-C5)-methyltransferase
VKSDPEKWAEVLEAEVLPTGSLRKVSGGFIPDMPGFTEGEWWIQNAAAALPAKLLFCPLPAGEGGDPRSGEGEGGSKAGMQCAIDSSSVVPHPNPLPEGEGITVIDLCAAPGGKTAQLCAQGAKVIAVDRSAERVKRLKENMARLHCEIETVIADGATWKPTAPVDAVLLDAPCTATGTIRHQPDILHLKEPKDQEKLAALQRRLIVNAANMLKPGGILIYCTCSIQKAESEVQVDWVMEQKLPLKLLPITPDEIPGIAEMLTERGEIRCLPQQWKERGGIDGFFVARFAKL